MPLGQGARVRTCRPSGVQLGHQPRWQIETDHGKTSEVAVRFKSEAPQRTRVELEHRHLDRHGEGWQQTHESISGEGGWPGCLRRFAERLAA